MIGETIARLRRQKRWSQQTAADRLGIAKSTYAGYESGYREPGLDTLRQLAELFEVSLDQLAGTAGAGHSPTASAQAEYDDGKESELGVWFKELLEAPEERREQLRAIWEIIKQKEAGRMPGDKQGES